VHPRRPPLLWAVKRLITAQPAAGAQVNLCYIKKADAQFARSPDILPAKVSTIGPSLPRIAKNSLPLVCVDRMVDGV
jgi:hypothetical protein